MESKNLKFRSISLEFSPSLHSLICFFYSSVRKLFSKYENCILEKVTTIPGIISLAETWRSVLINFHYPIRESSHQWWVSSSLVVVRICPCRLPSPDIDSKDHEKQKYFNVILWLKLYRQITGSSKREDRTRSNCIMFGTKDRSCTG